MRSTFKTLAIGLLASVAAHAPASALASDNYPNKPIKLVVPFSPGGGTDALARIVAQKLGEKWGQPVVVDNRPGAEGVIGSQHVATSPADGYTLLWAVQSHAINPSMRLNMPFDTLQAFVPITQVAATPYVIAAGKKLDARNMSELFAQAKAAPDKIAFGTSDAGARIMGELIKTGAGVRIVNAPYKGSGPLLNDVLGGHIEMGFISLPSAMSHYKAGTIKLLGVSTPKRTSLAPELPTMEESGLRNFDLSIWWGMLAPAGTSPDIVAKIQRDLAQIGEQPDFRDALTKLGAEPVISTPRQFAIFLTEQVARASQIVKAAGIQPE